jgi:hypothetical protein
MTTNIFTKEFASTKNEQEFAVYYVALLTKKSEWRKYCNEYSVKIKKNEIEIYFGGMKVRSCKNASIAYSEMERLPLRNLSIKSFDYYVSLLGL